MDFTFLHIRGVRQTIFFITDTGTGYTEAKIVDRKDINNIIRELEHIWICRHRAPLAISADDEYNRSKLVSYLSSHDISFKPRPTRGHNKIGFVERKNQTIKSILNKLKMEKSNATASEMVTRATFLSNMYSGSRIFSSFELVGRYQPSVLGIPPLIVPTELLEAHMEQAAARALQRAIYSRTPATPLSDIFKPNDCVWVWYATSKQNERDKWVRAPPELFRSTSTKQW